MKKVKLSNVSCGLSFMCVLGEVVCSQKDIFSVLSMSGCWDQGTTTCIYTGQQNFIRTVNVYFPGCDNGYALIL